MGGSCLSVPTCDVYSTHLGLYLLGKPKMRLGALPKTFRGVRIHYLFIPLLESGRRTCVFFPNFVLSPSFLSLFPSFSTIMTCNSFYVPLEYSKLAMSDEGAMKIEEIDSYLLNSLNFSSHPTLVDRLN